MGTIMPAGFAIGVNEIEQNKKVAKEERRNEWNVRRELRRARSQARVFLDPS